MLPDPLVLFCICQLSEFEAHFVREAFEGGPSGGSLLCGFEAADDVLECGCHNKVLLLQTKLFSLEELRRPQTAYRRADTEPQNETCMCSPLTLSLG